MEYSYKGLSVKYMEAGSGNLVILFHGWGANKELFQPMMHLLAEKYHVIALDIPGFGASEEPKEAWCLDDYCDFAKEFILYVQKGEEISLAGHSHGGRLLIKLLGREKLPCNIKKLVLIDSAGIVHEKTKEQQKKIKRYKRGKQILNLPIVKQLFPNALEKFQSKSGSADYRAASVVMRSSMVKVVNEDVRQYLDKITAETLLIWGENDKDTPLEDGKLMEEKIKGSGLVVLKGAGHFSFLDSQYQFLAVMKSFFEI